MCLFAERYRGYPSLHRSSRWQMTTEENDAAFCGASRSTVLQARGRDKQLPCLTNILPIQQLWGAALISGLYSQSLARPWWSPQDVLISFPKKKWLLWQFLHKVSTSVKGNLSHRNILSQVALSGMFFGVSTWAPPTHGCAEEPPHCLMAWCDQPLTE